MIQDWAIRLLQFFEEYGFIGITVGLMIEIIPSEIVLAYGGYLVAIESLSFPAALAAGVFGGTLAQLFLYWLGIYGGRPFFDRYGKFLLIKKAHLDAAESWFDRHGTIVIFTARFIPIVRHAISIPAGIAKMPFGRFFIYTAAAMIPWTILFVLLGIQLENRWDQIDKIAYLYLKPIIIIALIALLVYFLIIRTKHRKMSNKRK